MPESSQPPGWYYAQGDPPGTQRYWDGLAWQGGPQVMPTADGAGTLGGLAGGRELAGGGGRILARLIDYVVFFGISFVAAFVIGAGEATSLTGEFSTRAATAGLIGGLAVIAYEVLMTANGGQTVGKKVLSIKIVTEDGRNIDMATATRRFSPYIAMTVGGLIPVLGIFTFFAAIGIAVVSLFMIFLDGRNQAVWDKIASTLVIKA